MQNGIMFQFKKWRQLKWKSARRLLKLLLSLRKTKCLMKRCQLQLKSKTLYASLWPSGQCSSRHALWSFHSLWPGQPFLLCRSLAPHSRKFLYHDLLSKNCQVSWVDVRLVPCSQKPKDTQLPQPNTQPTP